MKPSITHFSSHTESPVHRSSFHSILLLSLALSILFLSPLGHSAVSKFYYQKTLIAGETEIITIRGEEEKALAKRYEIVEDRLNWIISEPKLSAEDVIIKTDNKETTIYVKERLFITVTAQDGLYNQMTVQQQAENWQKKLAQVLPQINAGEHKGG